MSEVSGKPITQLVTAVWRKHRLRNSLLKLLKLKLSKHKRPRSKSTRTPTRGRWSNARAAQSVAGLQACMIFKLENNIVRGMAKGLPTPWTRAACRHPAQASTAHRAGAAGDPVMGPRPGRAQQAWAFSSRQAGWRRRARHGPRGLSAHPLPRRHRAICLHLQVRTLHACMFRCLGMDCGPGCKKPLVAYACEGAHMDASISYKHSTAPGLTLSNTLNQNNLTTQDSRPLL